MDYDFMFAGNFPSLQPSDFNNAYAIVKTMFQGVAGLWKVLGTDAQTAKVNLCYQFLTAWYLAVVNNVSNIAANGGMPLTSKSIGGTSVSYEDIMAQEGLQKLKANTFGIQALSMIQSCPERFNVFD
jgi:hypothetical protein